MKKARKQQSRLTSRPPNQSVRTHAQYMQEERADAAEAAQRRSASPLEPKTENQRKYMNAIRNYKLTFGLGPAGTGKTYLAGAIAADLLDSRAVDKIIITRPVVEAGESLGFLPGELDEKYEPYLQPLRAVFVERLGRSPTEYFMKAKKIEPMPLAYMRGMTFKDCVVILDEAQNVTPQQMKMFLTRIGENCTVIINGDIDQKDIPGPSGLEDAVKRISYIPSVKVVRFGVSDVVRSDLVGEIITAYARPLQ